MIEIACSCMKLVNAAGNSFAPEGGVYWGQHSPVELPADQPCLLKLAICSALCNDSSLSYVPGMLRSHAESNSLFSQEAFSSQAVAVRQWCACKFTRASIQFNAHSSSSIHHRVATKLYVITWSDTFRGLDVETEIVTAVAATWQITSWSGASGCAAQIRTVLALMHCVLFDP